MEDAMVPIFVMGKRYEVPEGMTIMSSMEWIGYRFIRGCGCRGGFCGACATVYRLPGDFKLRVGLACQTTVTPFMALTQIPFFPAKRAKYDLEKIDDPFKALLTLYPEVTRCLGCNSCTKACPQNLKPMNYIAAARNGNWKKAAELSFDCIMCGLCASRCPAEIVPYNVAMFVRRYFSKYQRQKPAHLSDRTSEIKQGKYDRSLKELVEMDENELRKMYEERDFEKL
jgi:formate hydrogenlyase subunit 6/NADH:ubiquinone oxidoreductase subunit I